MASNVGNKIVLSMLFCALCVPVIAYASALDTHDSASGNTGAQLGSELYPGESDDVGPQVVLAAKSTRMHIELMADSQYYHTSNMFLTEENPSVFSNRSREGTNILLSTIEVAGTIDPTLLGDGEYQPRFGFRQQWYDFSFKDANAVPPLDANDLDFYAQTVFLEAHYRYQKQWIFEGGLDWTQLSYTNGNSNFYSEAAPRWAVRRLFTLDDTRVITAGYQGAYRFARIDKPINPNPLDTTTMPSDIDDRLDTNLFVDYTQALTPKLIVQPYYRFKQTNYAHYQTSLPPTYTLGKASRNDYLHSVGVSLYYYLIPEISLRAFASYDVKDSTVPENDSYPGKVFDYKKLDAGLGINVNYKF